MRIEEINEIIKGIEKMLESIKNEIDMLNIIINDYEVVKTSEGEKLK